LTSDKVQNTSIYKSIFNYGISAALAVIFLYIAFYNVNLGEVIDLVSGASIFWIIIFTVSVFMGHIIRAVRWKVILHTLKPDASLKNLFGALMIGYGVNCVTPKLGEITRAVFLGKWENLSRSSMLGTVVVERVIDVISLGLAVLVSAFMWRESLYQTLPWLGTTLYFGGVMMLGIIFMIYMTVKFKEKFYGVIIRLFSRISEKWANKLAHIFEMLTEGFTSLKGAKNYLFTIFLTIVLLLLYALSSYIGFFTLYMNEVKYVTFEMGWILMSIAAIGVVIPTPGATGSYHAIAKSTLVLLFGFGETISAAYAFLTHIISYFLFIFTALFVFFVFNKKQNNIFKAAESDMKNS
jgi:uncharacterized protein (TIRG00374 family)